jgi:hypothetical protein
MYRFILSNYYSIFIFQYKYDIDLILTILFTVAYYD